MGRYRRAVSRRARTAGRRAQAAAAGGAICLLSGCGLVGGPQTQLANVPQINVTSPMSQQGTLSARYTCHGKGGGESPPISWSGIPPGTRSVALVVDDAAAPITPRLYWIVFDISPDTTDLQAGALPTGARQARNSTAKASYDPPCPVGSPHKYRFTVYALNTMLRQPSGTPEKLAWSAIARHAIAHGRLPVTADP